MRALCRSVIPDATRRDSGHEFYYYRKYLAQ